MTQQQKRAVAFTAAGVGAALIARAAMRRPSAYDFSGQTVLITGGSRGLGLVIARQFALEGAHVILVARSAPELERAADDLRTRYPSVEVFPIVTDVRHAPAAERAIAQTVEAFGAIDVLVNNAGVIEVGPFDHMTLADYEDAMQTHFWGPLYMIKAALPFMRRQGGGRIVNISSIGGRISVPHLLPYSASKFALSGLSEGLRPELARDNISVTTVYPGLMRTGSPVQAMFKGQQEKEYAWFAISDSLPVASINAERAARLIVDACRQGDAQLVITIQAKLAILAHAVAPGVFARAMTLVNSMLPSATGRHGDRAKSGRDSESPLAGNSSPLTALTYNAAKENNEL